MKATVITVVYNRVSTIREALASVAAQSYNNIEHIVIDGASTDGTLEAIISFARPNMRVISEPDQGIYDALNKGMAAATGDIIGLMHSDDFFAHEKVIENIVRTFEISGATAVYGDLDYVSTQNTSKVVRHWASGDFSLRKLSRGWMPPHPTLFLRREVVESFGGYDTSYCISADYEAILRWFGQDGVIPTYLPEVLVKMRIGGESNRSIGRILKKSQEDYRALRSTAVGGIGALVMKNLCKIPQFLGGVDKFR